METLANHGIITGVVLMPVLPYIEDNEENITQIVTRAYDCGASYIIPSFGMSLRDRQRAYYYEHLDKSFPGLRSKYERRYGYQYHCPVDNAERLEEAFMELCGQLRISTAIIPYARETHRQLQLI
jgi:DNA repair photolyase